METLLSLFPTADDLLAMPAEDLGLVLLKLARNHVQSGGMFWPGVVTETRTPGPIAMLNNPYPHHKMQQVEAVLSEAWEWLRSNSLITPAPGYNGSNGHMIFTRKGQDIADGQDFESYKAAKAFPKTMLHPTIVDELWPKIVRGDYGEAVLVAFRRVEEMVREVGGFKLNDTGKPLMRLAFNKDKGPLTDFSDPDSERESRADLFAGALGSYKNPHSHRTEKMDPRDAQEQLVLASHLLRIVDGCRARLATKLVATNP